MNTLKNISVFLFIVSLCLAAQMTAAPTALGQGSEDAQGEGTVSLPEIYEAVSGASLDQPNVTIGVPAGSPVVGTNVRAAGGPGTGTQAEISIASSGNNIVITFNGGPAGAGFVTSTDGGLTWSANASPPSPAGSNPCCDPAVVADLLGRFYFVQLYRDDGANSPGAGNCTNSLHVSNDGGQNFGNILSSPFSFAPGTTDFPDMPHIGIDRVNLVSGQPQLYVFTRHFTSGINCPQTGTGGSVQGEVVCSTDGGNTWSGVTVLSPPTDLAHWATGGDGSVYLVGNGSGTQANTASILLRRSTNDCNAGLAFGAPATVADNVTFGASGIDREFPQPYVVVDRLDPSIAYVAWSADRLTGDGDRDVFIARCTFTGVNGSCEAAVRVNDNPVGDNTPQYFPALCISPNNEILMSWNDARAGGLSTGIYHTEIEPTGAGLGVGENYLTSEINFTPFNFGGAPDYGDYSENNDACNAEHLFVAWSSHVSPPGIVPASNDPDIFFAVANNVKDIRVSGPLDFGDQCLGSSSIQQLQVYNTGDATLTINNVSRVSGSTDITVEANPTVPLKVSPDGHVAFDMRCTPSSFGLKTATIRVESNDPDQPHLDLNASCNVEEPDINVSMADAGMFGNLCTDRHQDKTLQLLNQGACNLTVNSISSSNATEFVLPASIQYPIVLSPDATFDVPVRFEPDDALVCSNDTARTSTITINSDDPDEGSVTQDVSGIAPCPTATTSGELGFGELCIGESEQQTVKVCDTGKCNLTVTNATLIGPDCDDLTLVNPPDFPLVISPDFCFDFTVEFAPDDLTAPNCSLEVTTNDPANPVLTFPIDATIGTAELILDPAALSELYAFPPTVTDPNGDLGCFADRTAVIRNNGTCPAAIASVSAAGAPFSVIAPTQFPIVLPPGEETLDITVRFAPADGGGSVTMPDETTGTLTVVSNDPDGDLVGDLCGEAVVQSGGRWLIVDGADDPIASVDRFTLQSFGLNTPSPIKIVRKDLAPSIQAVCGNTVTYHLQREDLPPTETTGNSPNSSYTLVAKDGNLQLTQEFTLGKCEFKEGLFKLAAGADGVSVISSDDMHRLLLPLISK